jgi:hypothetical protein
MTTPIEILFPGATERRFQLLLKREMVKATLYGRNLIVHWPLPTESLVCWPHLVRPLRQQYSMAENQRQRDAVTAIAYELGLAAYLPIEARWRRWWQINVAGLVLGFFPKFEEK